MSAQVTEDRKNIQALFSQGEYQAVYHQYAAVLQEMLFVQSIEEWLDYVDQGGQLEEGPLELYLSAWRGERLLLGGYHGDATQAVLDYLREKIPAELWEKLGALPPIVIDMDERDGALEKQIMPYQERLQPMGVSLHIGFEDTYCAGAYFLSVVVQEGS
ncbi:MAG: hypothetical protein HFF50_07055 [Lawsonibacter sp.]|nr:hypothetical protein [Lawsonibacter sp.]